VLLIYQSRR